MLIQYGYAELNVIELYENMSQLYLLNLGEALHGSSKMFVTKNNCSNLEVTPCVFDVFVRIRMLPCQSMALDPN